MENATPNLEMVLLEKPLCLKIGSKRFRLYQPTLGKLMLQRRLLKEITSDAGAPKAELPTIQTLIMVERKRQEVCELLALYSYRDSKDCLDQFRIEDRANEFMELATSDLATLLTAILTMPQAQQLMGELGIDEANAAKSAILSAKDTSGSMVCGGASIYGGILDHVMQRYGWSLQYALWGITAANLQLLSSDEQVSMYLTEDERKKIPPRYRQEKNIIDATDPANAAQIRELLSGRKKR